MLKRLWLLALPVVLLAGSASAAEEKKPKTVGQYIELQPVALPIVSDGQLVNYVFAYVKVNLTPSADVSRLRSREPFLRDALVREAHRAPFVVAGDWQKVDEARIDAVMLRNARALLGADAVQSVVVTSQTPQRRVMPPRPGTGG
jgi:hypothetical protein